MTHAIRARKSLALLAAAAVVAAGLALSPAIASPAHASTATTSAAKLLKKINSYRVAHGVPAYLPNAFIKANAQQYTVYIAKKKSIYVTPHPKTDIPPVESSTDARAYPAYSSGGKATSRLARLGKLFTTGNGASAISDGYYNYASLGLVITKDAIYTTLVVAHYDTPPLDQLLQGTPKISGKAAVGATLTAKPASKPTGATFTYSWRYGSTVLGTASTYVPTAADLGHKITLTTIASKDGYVTTSAKKSLAVKIVRGTLVRTKPVVTGSRNVGQTLTATVSPWGPGTVTLTYQWLRNGKAIKTTGLESSYTLVAADKGKLITVAVTGHESGFTAASATTTTKTKVGPALP